MASETSFTFDEIQVIYNGFKGQCNEMNEARLTSALGDALDLLQEVREVLEGVIRVADRKTVEFDRAHQLMRRLSIEAEEK